MNICTITVTNGDRFHLLSQVIKASLNEGVSKVIVVDNHSAESTKRRLQKLEEELKDKMKVIYLDENIGSAGGYKKGLQTACKYEMCEFIWLLDDDNKPQRNSLNELIGLWNNLDQDHKEEKVSLLSYRKDRIAYKESVMVNNPDLVLGRENSFLGFHIIDLPIKALRLIKRKLGINTFKEDKDIKYGKVAVAPYGGMFFSNNLINVIGFPEEKFFLYADDHEWSYRIIEKGGDIYLVLDSKVEDVDTSWHVKDGKKTIFQLLIGDSDAFRVYYSIRNRAYFEINKLVTFDLLYKVNREFLLIILRIVSLFYGYKGYKRLKLIRKAIKDAKNGNLGKIKGFKS